MAFPAEQPESGTVLAAPNAVDVLRWQGLHADVQNRKTALVFVRRRTDDLIRASQASCQRSRLQAASTDASGPIGRALRHAAAQAAHAST